eukprot:comp17682_c0_seq1/m.17518 comp17682_c0_seq1/g.17518  ORF comp17682_c0_seq1/g.17518 comp17682_c0_seq1/m.17518 type:complete len:752 (-) comp17682_c0_seq1:314-2569(-)
MASPGADLSTAWTGAVQLLQPDIDQGPLENGTHATLSSYVHAVKSAGMLALLQAWYEDTYQSFLLQKLLPDFLSAFQAQVAQMAEETIERELSTDGMLVSFSGLSCAKARDEQARQMLELPQNMFLQDQLSTYELPPSAHLTLPKYFMHVAEAHRRRAEENAGIQPLDEQEEGEEEEKEEKSQNDGRILGDFATWRDHLLELRLWERMFSNFWMEALCEIIESYVRKKCTGNFENEYLPELREWESAVVHTWIDTCILNNDTEARQRARRQAHFSLMKSLADLRISEMFPIIAGYDETEPALIDLRECMKVTNQRDQLVASLQKVVDTRLLHPGANTADIITLYISAIKALRLLDPSQVVLHQICDGIQWYLREREDTVRCVVKSLTEEEGQSDLIGEIGSGPKIDDDRASDDEPDAGEDPEKWEPDPVEAKEHTGRWRNSDIISNLVGIYGSKELFVSEYRVLLADRLLSALDYEIDKETRTVELLKLRFGEASLHYCEVMLKDVTDSRRINNNVHFTHKQKFDEEMPVHVTCISRLFWPQLKDETFVLPEAIIKYIDRYNKGYTTLKAARRLDIKPHYGKVSLELTFEDRTLQVTVAPLAATIICLFETQATWTMDELAAKIEATPSALRPHLAFWVSQGVLEESPAGTYTAMEIAGGAQKTRSRPVYAAEEEGSPAGKQRNEDMQMYMQFITGMLTNLGSLPADRIHTMLGMFAGGSLPSQQQLKSYLDQQVANDVLEYSMGEYRLKQ